MYSGKRESNNTFVEKQLPYTYLFYYKIKGNTWIRQPENIITVHETFKSINFYNNPLIPEVLDREPFVGGDLYYNKSLRTKIDSLVFYYPEYQQAPKYYKEFWMRRSTENNDSTVFIVLTEIQQILKGDPITV